MAARSPVAAPRFSILIDGVEIGGFSDISGLAAEVTVAEKKGRSLLAHELTHTVQQNANGKPVTVRIGKVSADRAGLQKLQAAARRQVKVIAHDQRGTPVFGFTGIVTSAKTDVLQQEWELTYEAIQRVL